LYVFLYIEEIEEHNITTRVIRSPNASLSTSSLLVNSSFGSDVEVNSPNATTRPIHISQINYNIEEDIQSLNTSPLMNSSFGSDVEVNSPNATSRPIHMAQINYNIEEDIQSLNTLPLMNSSLVSNVEEAMFSFNTSLPAPLMVSPYNSDVEVMHSPVSSPVNGSQIHFDAEENDLQEEIELSGDSSLSLIWTPRIVMVSPPTVVTPPPEFPLLPLVPRQTVSPIIEIELNMAISI